MKRRFATAAIAAAFACSMAVTSFASHYYPPCANGGYSHNMGDWSVCENYQNDGCFYKRSCENCDYSQRSYHYSNGNNHSNSHGSSHHH